MSPRRSTGWPPRRPPTASRSSINSGYRSDAEQQELWNANPDPQMVAPPGTSLHRCGTELDLGPPDAYGWLAANAGAVRLPPALQLGGLALRLHRRPGAVLRRGRERRARPTGSGVEADGELAGGGGLPAFVPRAVPGDAARLGGAPRTSPRRCSRRRSWPRSNFNPNAVSPAGAQGIAQFMPATAIAYGLDDPFDPEQAIEAQATMMGELLAQFGSVELALAAYNAGPGAVAGCNCIPPYPETQAYVVRIMGAARRSRRAGRAGAGAGGAAVG